MYDACICWSTKGATSQYQQRYFSLQSCSAGILLPTVIWWRVQRRNGSGPPSNYFWLFRWFRSMPWLHLVRSRRSFTNSSFFFFFFLKWYLFLWLNYFMVTMFISLVDFFFFLRNGAIGWRTYPRKKIVHEKGLYFFFLLYTTNLDSLLKTRN